MRNNFIVIFLSLMLGSQYSFAQITLTIGPGANWTDNLLNYSNPNYNYATYGNFAANAWSNGGFRSLVKFNLNSIPTGANIQSATLYLYSNPTVTSSSAWNGNSQLSGSNAVFFEKVTENWSESNVTWNNQPATTTSGRIWFPPSTSTTENIQVNITSFVQSWIDNPSANYGMKMRLENEVQYRSRTYASENHTDTNIRPKLVITYTAPLGCDVAIDSAAAVSLPYYNNNQFLLDLVQQVEGGGVNARTTTGGLSSAVYKIPIKAWIYESSTGGDVITDREAEQYINTVNKIFEYSGVKIMFYLGCNISRIQNDDWYNGKDLTKFGNEIWNENWQENMLNIHFVNSTPGNKAMAELPIAEYKPYKCFMPTGGKYTYDAASALTHEIGHSLGLLHTHDNARGPGEKNGKAFGCYQEWVDREATLSGWNGCSAMDGFKRCEVNGDMLCDTDADPLLRDDRFDRAESCRFIVHSNDDEDYHYDNDGQPWLPAGKDNALKNIMSYSDVEGCARNFTPMQRGVMYYHAKHYWLLNVFLNYTEKDNDPQFYQHNMIDLYENDNHFGNGHKIAINEIQNHTIHPSTNSSTTSCDVDWVTFDINSTKTYEIQTRALRNLENVDTFIELYNINQTPHNGGYIESLGSLITSNDDSGDDYRYSKITRSLSPGRYAVKIKGWSSSSKGFYSIEVSDECYELTNSGITISGPSGVCSGELSNFFVQDLGPGFSYNWSVVGSGLKIESGLNSNSIYVSTTSTSSGTGTVDLIISSSTGCTYNTPTKNIKVNNPHWTGGAIQGDSNPICTYSTALYYVPLYNNQTYGYSWSLYPDAPHSFISGQGTNDVVLEVYQAGSYSLSVTVQGPCGPVTTTTLVDVVDSGCLNDYSTAGSYNYYPNPPDGELTVSLKDKETYSDNEEVAQTNERGFEVKLINSQGVVSRSKKSSNGTSLKIQTGDLPNGLYYLHVVDQNGIVKKQILIEH